MHLDNDKSCFFINNNVLCKAFTPTRNALDFKNASQYQGKHKHMKEHEDIYVALVEKYTLDGAHAFTLMKHKHIRHTHE